jgi:hypothetical protein
MTLECHIYNQMMNIPKQAENTLLREIKRLMPRPKEAIATR